MSQPAGAAVFAVLRLRGEEELAGLATELMAALAGRPGYLGGELGHAVEDPQLWALTTRWDGVGSYRRALSAYEVKVAGAPVWLYAVDEPGVFLTD